MVYWSIHYWWHFCYFIFLTSRWIYFYPQPALQNFTFCGLSWVATLSKSFWLSSEKRAALKVLFFPFMVEPQLTSKIVPPNCNRMLFVITMFLLRATGHNLHAKLSSRKEWSNLLRICWEPLATIYVQNRPATKNGQMFITRPVFMLKATGHNLHAKLACCKEWSNGYLKSLRQSVCWESLAKIYMQNWPAAKNSRMLIVITRQIFLLSHPPQCTCLNGPLQRKVECLL